MSLDGIIGGSDVDTEQLLHEWFFEPSERNAEYIDELRTAIGAVVMGRRTYEEGASVDGFVDNPYPIDHFVLSHDVPETTAAGETSFTFVTAGIESAVEQASGAADTGVVCIMGGAETVQQHLEAGLVDKLWIHLVPVLLGDEIRLFDTVNPTHIELEPTNVVATPAVTHLQFAVVGR